MLHRRGLIVGLISLVAAPAIARAGSLMPVKNSEPMLLDAVVRLQPTDWKILYVDRLHAELNKIYCEGEEVWERFKSEPLACSQMVCDWIQEERLTT